MSANTITQNRALKVPEQGDDENLPPTYEELVNIRKTLVNRKDAIEKGHGGRIIENIFVDSVSNVVSGAAYIPEKALQAMPVVGETLAAPFAGLRRAIHEERADRMEGHRYAMDKDFAYSESWGVQAFEGAVPQLAAMYVGGQIGAKIKLATTGAAGYVSKIANYMSRHTGATLIAARSAASAESRAEDEGLEGREKANYVAKIAAIEFIGNALQGQFGGAHGRLFDDFTKGVIARGVKEEIKRWGVATTVDTALEIWIGLAQRYVDSTSGMTEEEFTSEAAFEIARDTAATVFFLNGIMGTLGIRDQIMAQDANQTHLRANVAGSVIADNLRTGNLSQEAVNKFQHSEGAPQDVADLLNSARKGESDHLFTPENIPQVDGANLQQEIERGLMVADLEDAHAKSQAEEVRLNEAIDDAIADEAGVHDDAIQALIDATERAEREGRKGPSRKDVGADNVKAFLDSIGIDGSNAESRAKIGSILERRIEREATESAARERFAELEGAGVDSLTEEESAELEQLKDVIKILDLRDSARGEAIVERAKEREREAFDEEAQAVEDAAKEEAPEKAAREMEREEAEKRARDEALRKEPVGKKRNPVINPQMKIKLKKGEKGGGIEIRNASESALTTMEDNAKAVVESLEDIVTVDPSRLDAKRDLIRAQDELSAIENERFYRKAKNKDAVKLVDAFFSTRNLATPKNQAKAAILLSIIEEQGLQGDVKSILEARGKKDPKGVAKALKILKGIRESLSPPAQEAEAAPKAKEALVAPAQESAPAERLKEDKFQEAIEKDLKSARKKKEKGQDATELSPEQVRQVHTLAEEYLGTPGPARPGSPGGELEGALVSEMSPEQLGTLLGKSHMTREGGEIIGDNRGYAEAAGSLPESSSIEPLGLGAINDSTSHGAGDAFLHDFANLVANAIKGTGAKLYHIGGPKFAIRSESADQMTAALEAARAASQNRANPIPIEVGEGSKFRDTFRQHISDMNEADKRQALLIDEGTGLGNERAFEERLRTKKDNEVVAYIDGDSWGGLKEWLADLLGAEVANETLDEVAAKIGETATEAREGDKIWADHGLELFRLHGDEFAMIGDGAIDFQELFDTLGKQATLPFKDDGVVFADYEPGFSVGIGDTKGEADARLATAKDQRQSQGHRAAKGERPKGLSPRNDGSGGRPLGEGEKGEHGPAERERDSVPEPGRPQRVAADLTKDLPEGISPDLAGRIRTAIENRDADAIAEEARKKAPESKELRKWLGGKIGKALPTTKSGSTEAVRQWIQEQLGPVAPEATPEATPEAEQTPLAEPAEAATPEAEKEGVAPPPQMPQLPEGITEGTLSDDEAQRALEGHVEAMASWERSVEDWARSEPDAIAFESESGARFLVSKETGEERSKYPWRTTSFIFVKDGKLTPSGHMIFKTKGEAVIDALGADARNKVIPDIEHGVASETKPTAQGDLSVQMEVAEREVSRLEKLIEKGRPRLKDTRVPPAIREEANKKRLEQEKKDTADLADARERIEILREQHRAQLSEAAWSPEAAVELVADSIEQLGDGNIDRLMDSIPEDRVNEMAQYIKKSHKSNQRILDALRRWEKGRQGKEKPKAKEDTSSFPPAPDSVAESMRGEIAALDEERHSIPDIRKELRRSFVLHLKTDGDLKKSSPKSAKEAHQKWQSLKKKESTLIARAEEIGRQVKDLEVLNDAARIANDPNAPEVLRAVAREHYTNVAVALSGQGVFVDGRAQGPAWERHKLAAEEAIEAYVRENFKDMPESRMETFVSDLRWKIGSEIERGAGAKDMMTRVVSFTNEATAEAVQHEAEKRKDEKRRAAEEEAGVKAEEEKARSYSEEQELLRDRAQRIIDGEEKKPTKKTAFVAPDGEYKGVRSKVKRPSSPKDAAGLASKITTTNEGRFDGVFFHEVDGKNMVAATDGSALIVMPYEGPLPFKGPHGTGVWIVNAKGERQHEQGEEFPNYRAVFPKSSPEFSLRITPEIEEFLAGSSSSSSIRVPMRIDTVHKWELYDAGLLNDILAAFRGAGHNPTAINIFPGKAGTIGTTITTDNQDAFAAIAPITPPSASVKSEHGYENKASEGAYILLSQESAEAAGPKKKARKPKAGEMSAIGGDSFGETTQDRIKGGPSLFDEAPKRRRKPDRPKPKKKGRIAAFVDGILEYIAPQARGEEAMGMSANLRENLARAAQRDEALSAQLREYNYLFRLMPKEQVYDFINKMETGQAQDTAKLQEVADALRSALDSTRKLVQKHGKLKEFYENYFPHLYKDPTGAMDAIRNIFAGKAWMPTSFTKQRKYATIDQAIKATRERAESQAKAEMEMESAVTSWFKEQLGLGPKGLELAHDNPIEMVLARVHEMHRFVAGAEAKQRLIHEGRAIFVAESMDKDYIPAGYEFIDDPSFAIRATPEITVEEAYDKLLVDQLLSVASNMGVKHERVAHVREKRGAWGVSYGAAKKIETRFASPTSVLAHEIGHQIGDKFGLFNFLVGEKRHAESLPEHMIGRVHQGGKRAGQAVKKDIAERRAAMKRELSAIARLRVEKQGEVSKSFLDYINSKSEKEAAIMELWLSAPEKFAEVAPTVLEVWKNFLESQPALSPLLNLDRSIVLGTSATTFDMPGVLTIGKWAVPSEAATIIRNHMSPGLRGSKNAFTRGTFRGIRRLGNAMNQASLAMSAFHAWNVSVDAQASTFGIGLQEISRAIRTGENLGDIISGLQHIAESPLVPISALVKGHEIKKLMQMDTADIQDPIARQMVENVILAGGSASMNTLYHNQGAERLLQAVRNVASGDTAIQRLGAVASIPGRMLYAGLEILAKPIMEWQVPRLKLGVFSRLASDVYGQAARHEWSDARIQRELMAAWDSVDNRMGQLNYDNLHWNGILKDVSMAAVRSVGWNLGSIREYGGAIIDTATVFERTGKDQDIVTRRMGYAIGASMSYALQGSILMYLFTGLLPWEDEDEGSRIKNLFFPKTGRTNSDGSPERLSLPHYSKDWVAWATRPSQTVRNKLHPMWAALSEQWRNEDYYGTEVRNMDDPIVRQLADSAEHAAQSFIPFSVRNYYRMRDAGEDPGLAAIMSLSGVSSAPAYISRSKAHLAMAEIVRMRMPTGRVGREQSEARGMRRSAIRDLRSGKKVDMSDFSLSEIRTIEREAKLTPFQSLYSRMSFLDALNIYNISTSKERDQVFDMLVDKRSRARGASDDAIRMFYEISVTDAKRDKIREADVRSLGSEYNRLTSPRRRNESEDIYRERVSEAIFEIKRNPEFDPDRRAILAVLARDRERRGQKTLTPYQGNKITPLGKQWHDVRRILREHE